MPSLQTSTLNPSSDPIFEHRPTSRQSNGNGNNSRPINQITEEDENRRQFMHRYNNHYSTTTTSTVVGQVEGSRTNQFQYNQSSHGPLSQLQSHWNGNVPPPPGHHVSNSTNNGINNNRTSRPHHLNYTSRFQTKMQQQPSLINLDRLDLSNQLFQYPLLSGVVMLGTGKGTVKPPDIVLHGSQIAPQHAFIERLGSEVLLHPISEHTSLNGRKITGPTPLEPGNLISIGDSYFFRYDGPPSSPLYASGPHNNATTAYYEESPYAVINPRSKSNPSSAPYHHPAGDGSGNRNNNKNQNHTSSTFPSMMMSIESPPQSSSASSLTLESESQVCHPDQDPDRTDQSFTSFPHSPRSSSASTTTSDPDQTSSLCTEDSGSRKYRDGLESEQFVSKVARFEFMTHNNPLPPPRTASSSSSSPPSANGCGNIMNGNNQQNHNGNGYASSSGCHLSNEGPSSSSSQHINGYHQNSIYSEKKVLSRPNVNFNRSDQGYGNRNGGGSSSYDDSSLYSSSSVSPPDRASSSISNQNQSNSSSSHKPYRPGVRFYEDGQLTSPSPASYLDEEECSNSSFVNSSVPSPDSLSSSFNNHHHQRDGRQNLNHFHHNGSVVGGSGPSRSSNSTTSNTSIPSHHQFHLYNTNNNNHHVAEHSSFFNGNNNSVNDSNSNEAEIACETLLQIKRKQAEEARSIAEMTRKQDELNLDEILAMCEEYEEQIAKEIHEKRNNSSSSANTLSSNIITSTAPSPSLSLHSKTTSDSANESSSSFAGVGGANYNRQVQVHNYNSKSGEGEELETGGRNLLSNCNGKSNPKSPTSPTGAFNYGRIKTNGSLPRDMSKMSKSSPLSNRSNVSFANDEELSSIFTFSMTDSSNKSCPSSLMNGSNSFYNGMPDDVFNSPPLKMNSNSTANNTNKSVVNNVQFKGYNSNSNSSLSFRNGNSPYENVMSTTGSENSSHYPPLQVQSPTPPRLGIRAAGINNCRAMSDNVNTNGGSHQTQIQRGPSTTTMQALELKNNEASQGIMIPCKSQPSQDLTTSSHRVPLNCNDRNNQIQNNGNVLEKVEHSIPISTSTTTTTSTPTPTKSKLSVSFANSVKEFGKDDDKEEEKGEKNGENEVKQEIISGSGDNSSFTIGNGNNSGISSCNNHANKMSQTRSIVKTIATEVQVHNVELRESGANSKDSNTVLTLSNGNKSSSSSSNNVNNGGSGLNTDVKKCINQTIQSPSSSSSPLLPEICISKCGDDVREAPLLQTLDSTNINNIGDHHQCYPSPSSSFSSLYTNASQNLSQKETIIGEGKIAGGEQQLLGSIITNGTSNNSQTHPYSGDRITLLKKEIRDVEEQEMEAIREMEIEKALLVGEEKSLENQLALDTEELVELKDRLSQIDESSRRWKADGLERISELKAKLTCSEKELQRLERMHEEFCGSTDEETVLLERLKFQHEMVESDRKAFEDSEFFQMEEEINRETQRDEYSKLVADKGRKLLGRQFQLERVRSQNRISFGSATKEVQSLERKRQGLLIELRKTRESSKQSGEALSVPGSPSEGAENLSDYDDTSNADLEEKLRNLSLHYSSTDDELHIERIKSRSPIDPSMGGVAMGPKTCETLREIERNREFHLNEQGVQMLEEERARVRELQKRVQMAVREEWEASRKSRSNSNQCHSLNSVGSEDSGHTASDTPTDSGSGDDTTDKSAAPSISTTDVSLTENGQNSSLCQQMRQKQREMSQSYEETRPLSSGTSEIGFDENATSTVNRREKDKSRVQTQQNRPLTRYLPVRGGDEDEFDLKAHIESSGHQLELCSHITVNRTSARGFLSKLSRTGFHNWNKRWFVFDREKRTLVYYSDKNEKKSKSRGGVHFEAIEEVYVDQAQSVKSPMPKLTFCVKTHNRVFYLLAPSAEAMRVWVEVIFTGAEGYNEFKCAS